MRRGIGLISCRLHAQRRVIDRQDGQVAARIGGDDPRLVAAAVAEADVNLALARLGASRGGRPAVHDVIVRQNESFIGPGNGRDDDARAELVRNEVGRIGLVESLRPLGSMSNGLNWLDVGAGPDAGDADDRRLDPVDHVDEDPLQGRGGGQALGVVARERSIVRRGSTIRPPAQPEGLRRDGMGRIETSPFIP